MRLLEYSNDSKSLFFTTTLQNAVQSYSLRQAALLEPSHTHPSPPTVLATSSTSHLLLSASEKPPTIFLQNLTLRTPALQLQPRASSSAVEAAAFHPERPNVFLLAFKDGTLAAYDATRILGKAGRGGSGGEVGRFKGLHAVTNRVTANLRAETGDDQNVIGDQSVSITSAAFLPGHRSRAVSVGADGRCRLVDFECGGNILRTWHAKGPATSLSVLSVRQKQGQLARAAANRAETGAITNTLAVGREDGKVLVFDSVGILLVEQTVDPAASRIIDVQWMKGPSLKPHSKPTKVRAQQDADVTGDAPVTSAPLAEEPESATEEESEEFFEDDSGTVYHRPVEAAEQRPQLNAMNYMDLFSPVKQPPKNSPQRRSPRPRPRPRILSSTFRQSSSSHQTTPPRLNLIPQLKPEIEDEIAVKRPSSPAHLFNALRRSLAHEAKSPSKLPSPTKRSGSPRRAHPSQEIRVAKTPSSKTPRARKSRRTSARMPGPLANVSSSRNVTSTSSSNSKILADIRRLGESGGKKIAGLALLAPYMNQRSTPRSSLCVEHSVQESETKPERAKPKAAGPADDIWLTSDDEAPASHVWSRGNRLPSQRTRLRRLEKITFVPTSDQHARQHSGASSAAEESEDDESAERMIRQPLSPGAALSPGGPVHLQEYFPRRSSLEHRGSGNSRAALGDLGNNKVRSPELRNGRKSGLGISGLGEAVHGEQQAENGCECGKKCCAALRKDVQNLGEELRLLREEMAEMRFLMGR